MSAPGFVPQLAQRRIDDLDVRAVAVDEDDAIEAVVDQAAAHVVEQVEVGFDAKRHRAGAHARGLHVLRAVAEPQRRRVEDAGLLARAPRDLGARDRIAVERQMRPVLFERRLRDEDRVAVLQVLLHVGRRQVAQAVGRQLQLVERRPPRRVRLVLVGGLDVVLGAARALPLVPRHDALGAGRRAGRAAAAVVVRFRLFVQGLSCFRHRPLAPLVNR